MVIGAAQWLWQHLKKPLRPRRCRPAFALPTEIITMVASHLTTSSLLSLSLTCRTLYTICCPSRYQLDASEKEELLLWLEMDIAELYFCHYCINLHRWNMKWHNDEHLFIYDNLPCRDHLLRSTICLPHSCYVQYHRARLVMNRHLYGPDHGLPLEKLKRTYRWRGERGVTELESWQARIVDDRLVLRSIRTMYHFWGSTEALRQHVDSYGVCLCQHLTIGKYPPCDAPVQLPELVRDKAASDYFTACHQSFGSCSYCMTDYSIDVSWRSRWRGYVIQIYAYSQLGDCRSPFDWNWRCMTEFQTYREPRMVQPLEHGIGVVRKSWTKADDIDDSSEGVWVELPRLASRKS